MFQSTALHSFFYLKYYYKLTDKFNQTVVGEDFTSTLTMLKTMPFLFPSKSKVGRNEILGIRVTFAFTYFL